MGEVAYAQRALRGYDTVSVSGGGWAQQTVTANISDLSGTIRPILLPMTGTIALCRLLYQAAWKEPPRMGIWSPWWHEYWVWESVWEKCWHSSWVDTSYTDDDGNYVRDGYWDDWYHWVDNGYWDDQGWWAFNYDYSASFSAFAGHHTG